MPQQFQLKERICGFSMNSALAGETVKFCTQEVIGPRAPHLVDRLEQIQNAVFGEIPGIPPPSLIDHLLVLIGPDLKGIAYVNELQIQVSVRVNREIQTGAIIFRQDVSEVISVELGVDIPNDHAVILVRSSGWKRTLLYDLGPLIPDHGPRTAELQKILVRQEELLFMDQS